MRLPGGKTAYFVSLHRNKQGIEVVDLEHPRGREPAGSTREKA